MTKLAASILNQTESIEKAYDLIQEHETSKAFVAFLEKLNIGQDQTRDLTVLENVVKSPDLQFCHKYAIAALAIVLGLRKDVRA